MPIYEARPDGAEPRRGVVVVQEAFGVNNHIEAVTRRFAAAGYHAMAPHIFHRAGGGTAPYGDFEDVERLRAELGRIAVEHEVVRYGGAGHGFHCDEERHLAA
jgi:carboxymethylenebutenolidase